MAYALDRAMQLTNHMVQNELRLGFLYKTSMELAAVGDFMFQYEFATNKTPFNSAFQVLSNTDVVFANLETPLGRDGYPKEKNFVFITDPARARVLRSVGVDVVSIANNHMLDYGEQGLLQTLEVLSRIGVRCVGGGRDIHEASKPTYLIEHKVKLAFLGYAATLPLGAAASAKRPGIAPIHVTTSYEINPTLLQEQPGNPPKIRTAVDIKDEQRICENIAQARKKANHVIVGVHWGVGFGRQLEEYQRPLAKKMIEAGASLIIGHHSHIRHGVERYRNGVILYSLGDFVFQDRNEMEGESGMIATVILDGKGVRRLRLWPIRVDSKLGLPILGGSREAKQLLQEMKQISAGEDITLGRNWVELDF